MMEKNPSIFALIDGNNFFVSCERVFNPSIAYKPVIVLSNNDGCAISRSNEAKALGIAMGAPFHTFSHLIRHHDIRIFSANFELYADLSQRMMKILNLFTPDMEVYSIDEAFLILRHQNYPKLAEDLYQTILKQIGIPITIGMAPTKTLAKIANRMAKKKQFPFSIIRTPMEINNALKETEIGDVWGVGRNLKLKLKQIGIYTAYDLAQKEPVWAKKTMTVTGERLVRELQGTSCLVLSEEEPQRQNIQVTRSFGARLTCFEDIAEAVSAHATHLGEKLRARKLVTPLITVFCRTSPFSKEPYYKGIGCVAFDTPTNDTTVLIKGALRALKHAFKEGLIYQKAGIYAQNLEHEDAPKQMSLFKPKESAVAYSKKLCKSIDHINQRFGKDTTFWASSGINPRHVMKQNQRSPRYTTRWSELKNVSLLQKCSVPQGFYP